MTPAPQLRRVGVEAAPALSRLWLRTFVDAYRDQHSPENLDAYCRQNYAEDEARELLASPRSLCVIACRDGAAVGFYVVRRHPCPVPLEGGGSELKQIYVVSAEYGSGLGRLMFDDACEAIRTEGRAWIWLCVSDRNLRARRFYRKHGLRPVAPGPVLEVGTDRLPSTIMALRLAGP